MPGMATKSWPVRSIVMLSFFCVIPIAWRAPLPLTTPAAATFHNANVTWQTGGSWPMKAP